MEFWEGRGGAWPFVALFRIKITGNCRPKNSTKSSRYYMCVSRKINRLSGRGRGRGVIEPFAPFDYRIRFLDILAAF